MFDEEEIDDIRRAHPAWKAGRATALGAYTPVHKEFIARGTYAFGPSNAALSVSPLPARRPGASGW
jgi:hypothetical protein